MTEVAFIEPDALVALKGQHLFYPSAGSDWSQFISMFGDRVGTFHFCDINYSDLMSQPSPFADPSSYRRVECDIQGEPRASIEQPNTDRPYRKLKSAHLREVYERLSDSRRLTVVRRRGFGQYALAEFPDRSIGIFVHRGDSPGEGGSNVYFLANVPRAHEPLSNLFDKLVPKLADDALIVSDGSNARFRFLKRFHNKDIPGREAFELLREQCFDCGAFSWRCVGFIGARYGPTLVWQACRVG